MIRQGTPASARLRPYALTFLAYAVFAIIILFAIPGNPDPIPVPIDLLELFRALTMIGQFILWALLSSGVALALIRQNRQKAASSDGQLSAVGNRDSGS